MILSYLVALAIQFRRMNARIGRRVRATGGPVSGAYALSLMAWSVIKAMFWPITLVTYMLLGRPHAVVA